MNRHNEKTPHIVIDGEAYEMINVMKSNGELVASITTNNVISAKDYKVDFIKDANKIRFQEMD